MKEKHKERAIQLRKKGETYSEILKKVPVAKSTLSLWLRDIELFEPQKKRIIRLRRAAQEKGAHIRRKQRVKRTQDIIHKAQGEIGTISKRELWLIGVALYWAEGVKEKNHGGACMLEFTNSDPSMISIFILWLTRCCGVESDRMNAQVYIHENHRDNIEAVERYWRRITGLRKEQFRNAYFKKHNPKTVRHNTGRLYRGNLRVIVSKSSDIVRRVSGWVHGIERGLKNY